MADLTGTIATIRDGVVAILRIRAAEPAVAVPRGAPAVRVQCSFGSGFCVVDDRYIVTARHVLGGEQVRDAGDRFYVFSVPGNGERAYHFPVTGFPLERPDLDLAVLEIGPCATPGIHLRAVPVSFAPVPDGTAVLTVGYPSPEIGGMTVAPDLTYRGGQFFLKSHANEGIVAAQYDVGGHRMYELNVGWHHGESGGPVVASGSRPAAAFSLMQHYRNVQSPHGVVAGPHRGISLAAVASELEALGVAAQ